MVVCESVPDQRIGEGDPGAVLLFAEDHAREIFEIHLMADARIRRHDFEILETLLAPAEEGVALDIALHFEIGVEREGVRRAEFVHLHGMVDHQFGGKKRIDLLRIAAERCDGVAHGREVDDGGHAREILEQDARGHEGDFSFGGARGARRVPARQRGNIVRAHEAIVFVAQQIFEQHFQRKGKARDVADAGALERVQAIDVKRVAADAAARRGSRMSFSKASSCANESLL